MLTLLLILTPALAILLQEPAGPPIVCNLKALTTEDRQRQAELSRNLHESARQVRELRDGYSFLVDAGRMPVTNFAEWMSRERRCCPFFRFQLEMEPRSDDYKVTVTGPKGARQLLEPVFRARPK